MLTTTLLNFLPEPLVLEPGTPRDYFALERFHYRPKRPRTWQCVWRIRYGPRVIGVGVLSWPVATARARNVVFGLLGRSYGEQARFVNANLRTISRVVIHPQFRSLGLASALIHCLCDNCPTRYIEAMAVMARIHPMFDRAGLNRVDPEDDNAAVYYWKDLRAHQSP